MQFTQENEFFVGCIYKIINTVNGKFYIGRTIHFKKRWSNHLRGAKTGSCKHPFLYNSMRKYGVDAFKFEILEECLDNELIEKETYWINELKPSYNTRGDGCDGGWNYMSKEQENNTKKYLSELSKQRMEDPEFREKLSIGRKKLWEDPEFRKNRSIASKQRWEDPEYRSRVLETRKKNKMLKEKGE